MKKDLNRSGIYQIRNIVNGKVYVGSAVNIYIRWVGHKNSLGKQKHRNKYLQRSWNKYGEDNFIFEILEVVGNKNDLIKREQYWFDKIKCFDIRLGYNLCSTAGSTLGLKMSDGARRKISAANKGNNHNLGRKCTEETKKKIAQANKGNKHNLGRKHTKETKLKRSKFLKGNTYNLGKKRTEKTIRKLSKPVVQINPNNNLVIKTWNSMTAVSKFFKVSVSAISMAVIGQTKVRGFIWKKINKKTGEIIEPTS